MLYLIHKGNHPELTFYDGQESIIHLEANLHQAVKWAEQNRNRWAFSLSNAAAHYVEFRNNLNQLTDINWRAVSTNDWQKVKEKKQAEFLVENHFPWQLINKIGVYSENIKQQVAKLLPSQAEKPQVALMPNWYY